MKKYFFTLGLMLIAALTLTTNCSKQDVLLEENPGSELIKTNVPFSLFASTEDTKTSTEDGATISWVALDSLNVFHALAGSTEYGDNDPFEITSENLASNRFTGTLSSALDENKSYDWYVLYPYNSHINTPANSVAGYTAIGSKNKNTAQVQTGNSSKAHLAGQYFPMYGKATDVSGSSTPSITLSQALSVVKVHVTNSTSEPLTVNSVSFTAPGDSAIVGTFYIDFTGAAPVYKQSGSSYVSSTANLTVNSGSAIAQDGTADFYIAIKPFTAPAASTLKVAVNGHEKTVTVGGSGTEFKRGKIKTINFDYDYDVVDYSGDYLIGSYSSGSWKLMSSTNGGSFFNSQATSVTTAAASVNYTEFNAEVDTDDYIWTVAKNENGYYIRSRKTSKYLALNSAANAAHARDALAVDTSYFTIDILDNVATITNKKFTDRALKYNSGSPRFAFYTSAQTGISLIPATYDGRTKVALSFDVTTPSFTTSNYSDFTGQVASSDPDVTAVTNNITYSKTDEDGVITSLNASTGVVTLSGNTGSAIVTATFEGDGSYKRASTSYTITVTEAGGGESPTLQYTLDGTDSSQGTNGYATESSITQSEIDWIAVANTTINPWRFGGKNISNENRVVYSTTAIASNITSIEVESGTATATVNSLTITVHGSDTDAASGVNAIATKSVTSGITSSTVTLTKEDETSWAGKYYRIVYNVTCGGSNQYIQFKSAKFYGYDPE